MLYFPEGKYQRCGYNVLAKEFEILNDGNLDIMLSGRQIPNALIRLHGCAGWSSPLLFACSNSRLSHVEDQYFTYHRM